MPPVSPSTIRLENWLERTVQMQRVPFATGHMMWRRFGEGPPLVLLHEGHGSWRHWARNIEGLAKRYTVWLPDLPGYGDSDCPAGASLGDLAMHCTFAVTNALRNSANGKALS